MAIHPPAPTLPYGLGVKQPETNNPGGLMAVSDLTVASTTDSEADIRLAAGLPAEEPKKESEEHPNVEGEGAPKPEGESETPKPEGDKPKTESESETDEEELEERPKGKGNKLQARIDDLTRAKYDLRDENRTLKDRLAKLEAQEGGKKPTPEATKVDDKPKRADFQSDDEYFEALGRYGARQETAKLHQEESQRVSTEQLQQTYSKYNAGVRAFSAENPDFQEVLGESTVEVPQAVQVANINFEEEGPALAYHLAKNPEIVEKLSAMTSTRAVAEIGKLHAKLFPEDKAAPPVPKPKPQVKKPAEPIKPVKPQTKTEVRLDELPYSEYRKAREAQIKSQRGR